MAKKRHKKNMEAPRQKVTLSQCMIVKNEERNIEKALCWGKGIVCEQIVVDTGSTDRTVELAEHMCAKVLQFEWINDFAAAKNFAIEQASGDWIAFLDADEYFPDEYARKLLPILSQIMTDAKMRSKYTAISCPMDQLDDDGKSMEVNVQVRLFRNIPDIRYKGRIHEELSIEGKDIARTEDIRIHHTGYSESANVGKGKSDRNLSLLRAELKDNPNDLRMKMYLAESLIALSNEMLAEDEYADVKLIADEAEALHKEVVYGDTSGMDPEYKKTSYRQLLSGYRKTPEIDSEYEDICEKAIYDFPDDFKITCLYAAVLNKKGEYQKAFDLLQKLEARQNDISTRTFAFSVADMTRMCREMVTAAQGLGDVDSVFRYTSAILTADKTNTGMLGIYINMLIKQLPSYDSVIEILGMIYDLQNRDDVEIIIRAARECGAEALVDKL